MPSQGEPCAVFAEMPPFASWEKVPEPVVSCGRWFHTTHVYRDPPKGLESLEDVSCSVLPGQPKLGKVAPNNSTLGLANCLCRVPCGRRASGLIDRGRLRTEAADCPHIAPFGLAVRVSAFHSPSQGERGVSQGQARAASSPQDHTRRRINCHGQEDLRRSVNWSGDTGCSYDWVLCGLQLR
jgi:hypothetical protein